MSVVFKEVVTPEEVGQVAALARKIWSAHYTPLIGTDQVEFMLDKFQSVEPITEQIEKEGYLYYLLLSCDDEAVGYCAFQERGDTLFLSKVYVDHAARGKGYGRAIMRFAEATADRLGLNRLSLTVNKDNTGSIAVYKKMGFEVVDAICPDIGGGYVMDDYVMSLTLVSANGR